MTTTEWAHLPNAKHIDRVLADLGQRPEQWGAVWSAAWHAAPTTAWDAAWDATRDATRDAARGPIRDAARDAVRDAVQPTTWATARGAALDAILALVAWDDCAHLLGQPVDAVRLLAACGHHPALLLLPARIAFAKD
jgi:hypothetical protein